MQTTDRPRLSVPPRLLHRRLRTLDAGHRHRTHRAAWELVALLDGYAERGLTPLADALGGRAPEVWGQYAHLPERMQRAGEFFFYYHSHDRTPAGEHGHFHLFSALPGQRSDGRQAWAHLVGIGVDARGLPRRLFTTNRWVTDEQWIDAAAVCAELERILATPAADAEPLERWLRGVLTVFMPQIALLLEHRDRRIAARGERAIFEDRRMYVLSECRVALDDQARAIDAALG